TALVVRGRVDLPPGQPGGVDRPEPVAAHQDVVGAIGELVPASGAHDLPDAVEERGRVAGAAPHELRALTHGSGGRHVAAVADDLSVAELHVILAVGPRTQRIDQAGAALP